MKNNFRSYDLAVEFYRLSRTLSLEVHLKEQFSRAASSIVLNLAEGSGRKTKKDKSHFFQMAFGSLRECQAIVDLADEKNEILSSKADFLAANIFKLIKECRGA